MDFSVRAFRVRLLPGILLGLLLAGCGKPSPKADQLPTYPASGKVTYKGQAVEGALVRFLNLDREKPGAAATTNAQGEFKLMTYAKDDGAVVGSYLVLISKLEETAPTQTSGGEDSSNYVPPSETPLPPPKNKLPDKYSSASKAELKAEVTAAGPNQFTFDLQD